MTEGGFRTPFYLERAHALRDTVDAAVDKKLLRKLYIGEKEHVEIIHDVLAPVIKERRNRRLEEKKREEMEREMRRKRVITTIIAGAGMIAIVLSIFAFTQKNRADKLYREAICNRLASESYLILPKYNFKAIRIAEAAYKIGIPTPPASGVQALSSAAYSTQERPFVTTGFKHKGPIFIALFSPDNSKILTASDDKTAKLWDLQRKILADFKGHTDSVRSAVFSPDGSKILTASWDKTAKLWDLQGNLLGDFKGHEDGLTSAIFSPGGSKILTTSKDGTAKLWDLQGNILADFKEHTGPVNSAVFSPDGSKILTASDDTTANLWNNLNSISSICSIKHLQPINRAFFSPDGRYILTLSYERSVKIWNLDGSPIKDAIWNKYLSSVPLYFTDDRFTFEGLQEKTKKIFGSITYIFVNLHGHKDTVYDIKLSSDFSKILTASADKTAKLWDLKGNLLADLKGHTDRVNSAVFSPDGKHIVTASADGTAIIWLTPEGIMEYLKTAPIPKLTKKEKEELGIAGFKID